MPIELGSDDWRWKYIPANMGYRLFQKTDEDLIRDGMVFKKWDGDDDIEWWNYPEHYECFHRNLCPICLSQKKQLTPKGRSVKNTCSSQVCKKTYGYFQWEIELTDFAPIPADYDYDEWIEDAEGVVRNPDKFPKWYKWKHWLHRDKIEKKHH